MGEAFGDRRPCEQDSVHKRLQVRLNGICLKYGNVFENETFGFDLGLFNDTLVEMAFLGDACLRASGQERIVLPQIRWVKPVKNALRRAAYSRRSMRGLDRTRLFESPLAIPVQTGIYEEMLGKRIAATGNDEIDVLDDATYALRVAYDGIRLGEGRGAVSLTGLLPDDRRSDRG